LTELTELGKKLTDGLQIKCWYLYTVSAIPCSDLPTIREMTPFHINLPSTSGSGDWIIPLVLIGSVIWLCVLAAVLQRTDFDPITKLTWVIVVISVPVFGIILYLAIAPGNPKNSPREFSKKADQPGQVSGTPWENNPGYSAKSKEV